MQDNSIIKEIADGLGISTTDLLKKANTRVGIAGVRKELIDVGFIDESLTDEDMFSIFGKTYNPSFKDFLDGSGYDIYDIQDKVEKDPLVLLGLKKQLIADGFIEDNVLSDEDWYNAFGLQLPKQELNKKKDFTEKYNLPPVPKGFEISGDLIKNGDVLFKDLSDLDKQIAEISSPKTELDWTTGQSKTNPVDVDKLNKLKRTKSTYKNFLNNRNANQSANQYAEAHEDVKVDAFNNVIDFDLATSGKTPTTADIRKEIAKKEQEINTFANVNSLNRTTTKKDLEKIDLLQKDVEILKEREQTAKKVDALKSPEDFILDNEREFLDKVRLTGGNELAIFNLQKNNINQQQVLQQDLMAGTLTEIKQEFGKDFLKEYLEDVKKLNEKYNSNSLTDQDTQEYKDKYQDFMSSSLYKDWRNYNEALQKSQSYLKESETKFQQLNPEAYQDYLTRQEIYFNRDENLKDSSLSRGVNFLFNGLGRFASAVAETSAASGNNTSAKVAQKLRNFSEYFPSTSRAEAGVEQTVEFNYKGRKLKAVYDGDKVAYIRDMDDYIVKDMDGSITEYARENTKKENAKRDFSVYGLTSQAANVVFDVGVDALVTRGAGKILGGTKAAYNIGAGMSAFSRGFGATYNQLLETPGVSPEMANFGATVMGLAASQLTKINPLESDIAEKGFFNSVNKYVKANASRIAKGDITVADAFRSLLSGAKKVAYTGAKENLEELPELYIEKQVINPIINRVDGTSLEEEVNKDELISTMMVTAATGLLGMGKLPTNSNMKKQAINYIAQDLDTFVDFAEGLITANPDMTELQKYVTAAKELKVIAESPENRAAALEKLVELNQQKEELKSITVQKAIEEKKQKIEKLEQELFDTIKTEQSGSSLGTNATLTNATGELGGDDVNTPPSLKEEAQEPTPTPPEKLIDVLNIEAPAPAVKETELVKTPYQVQVISTDADGKETVELIDATNPKDIDENLFYHKDGNNFVITDKESGAEITRAKTLKQAKKNLETIDINGVLKDQRKKAKKLGIKIEPPVGEQSTTDSGSVTAPTQSESSPALRDVESTAKALEEPSLEQQLKDIKEGNTVTFEYKNESEVPEIFKDKISSKGEINGKPYVKVTMAKSLADFHLQEKPKSESLLSKEQTPTEDTEAKKAEVKRLEKELFEKSIPLKNWTSVEHNKYVTLLGLRGDVEKRDLLRNLEPSDSWQLYAVETLSEEEAKEVLNNVSTYAKADIPIGKVGNTHYEVKADGVYFEGKKLDNPENKTHKQLIEADIKRRRQEELKPVEKEIEKIQKEIDELEKQGSESNSQEIESIRKEIANLREEDGSIPDSEIPLFNKLSKKLRFLQKSFKSQVDTLVDSFSQINNLSEKNIRVLKRFVETTDYTFEEIIQELEKRDNTVYKRPSELEYFEDSDTRVDKLNETQESVDKRTNEKSKQAAKELGIDLDKVYYADELDDFVQKHGSKQTKFIWNLIKNIAAQLKIPTKFLLEGKDNNIAKGHQGEYSNGQVANRASLLTSPDVAARTIVHELVHGVTSYIIDAVKNNKTEVLNKLTQKQINAAKKLSNLLKQLQTDSNTKDFYGAKNEHEILAELTHDEFTKALKNKKLNFVEELLDYILDILGIPTNAYDEALSILKDMIENPVDYISEGFVHKGVYYSKSESTKLQQLKNKLQELKQQISKIKAKYDAELKAVESLLSKEQTNKTQTNEKESSKKDDNEKGISSQAKEGQVDSTLAKRKKLKPSKVSSKIKVGDTVPINGKEEVIADVITDPDGTVYSVYTEEGTEIINPNYAAENKTWLINEEPGITNVVIESLATTKEGIIEQIKDSILSQGVTEDYAEELAAARFAMWEAQAELQGIDGIEFMVQNIAAVATITDQQYQEMQEAAQQKEEAKKIITEVLESGINEQQIEDSNVNIYNNPDLLVEAYRQEALPGERVQEFIKRKYCI